MNIFAASGLVNGIISTAFGLLVIGKNYRERVNQIYFFMVLSLALWSFSYWQWLLAADYSTALYWVRLLSIGSLFIPIFFFHWVLLMTDAKSVTNKFVLIITYICAISILFFSQSPLFISNLEHKSFFNFWPNAGIVYDVYFSYLYVGLIIYSIYLLMRTFFLTKDGIKRGQLFYILLGAFLGFGGGLTNFPLWFGIEIPPYGNFLVAAFPFLLAYSVFKYRLFNARTISAELFVFFLILFLFIQTVISQGTVEIILRSAFLIIAIIIGILLIRSVYHEISQRERIEKLAADLQRANDRLTELDRQKSEFISFASHQLRAPLTAMKGYASLLLEGDMGKIPETAKEGIERIYESTKTLVTIVNDYLNVSRIELGTMKYTFEPMNLKELISDVIAELKPNIEKAKLEIAFKADPEPDYKISADKDKLKQVVVNLIDNAVKYTPKGKIEVSVSFDKNKNEYIFTVTDNGIGIAPEILPKLFQKFSRAENANRVNIKGTGLGLYVAKEMVTAHHGTIKAESAGEGKGSKFIVRLPVHV